MELSFGDIIRLAEEGNTDAMVAAIQEFVWKEHIDIEDTPKIREKTVEYLTNAIHAGNTVAMNQLGAMYAEGRLVEYDPERAFLFYKMAAELGNALAISNLGFCYLYGTGTEKNEKEAFKTFSKAAVLGIGDAIIRIGDMYMFGIYVEKDEKSAFQMYLKAYEMSIQNLNDLGMQQVYSDVCRRIGDCYYSGTGIDEDIYTAIKWYGNALQCYNQRKLRGDSYFQKGFDKTKKMLQIAIEKITLK